MHAVLYVLKMSWMSFLCLATAFLDLCRGHYTLFEGYDLSMSSYHLCTRHESTVVSKVLSYKISYTVRRSCGWLPWKMCEVTVYKKAYRTEYMNVTKDVLRCCDGYEQVGSYCALPMNRSGEFTAKPGSCPEGVVEAPRSGGCEWDLDCPGWQKCCQREGLSLCTDPQSSGSRGWCFHVTVTVKIDYQRLISMDGGILNHTRLLHSVVTGALDSYDISVYYISSWPIWPFRTSSSLLISSPEILSLSNTTTKLHLLLIHIEEVTSVSVEDMNECSHAALSSCSRQADCSNIEGSYSCTCHPGLIDLNPNNKGVHCRDPTPITNLQASNVTGSSFCVSWMTGQSQSGFIFLVVLMEGSKVRGRWETGLSVWEVTLLKPGVLYNVTVISCPYGSQGASLLLLVKTAAQTLGATAHLTNVQFTAALLDPTSQAYQNLSRSIMEEILQSLPPDILALVNSGDVRVQITGLAPGSVVVNFTIIFTPSQSQDILKVSSALMQALQNSSRYTVDSNNTSIDDVDECSTGNMDCSPWAQCTNTWGSYSCLCLDGFTDSNPSRPGRGCSAPLTTTTPMSTTTTNTLVTISNTVSTTTTYNTTSITSNNTDAATTNTPVTTTVNNTVRINNTVLTKTPVTITAPVPTKMTSGLMKTSLQPETPTSLAPLVSYTEAISVECRASAVTVTVARDFLWSGHIGDSSLFLGRHECGVNGGNSSHVQLTVAWDECNTQLLYNSTHYTAQVNLYNSMSSQLLPDDTTRVPTVRLKVPIMCTFRRSIIIISSGYSTTGYDMIKDAVMGSGTFYVTFQLLNGMSPLPQNYSLSPEEDVVVEVSVDSTVAQIKVVINKCWATQSSNPLEPTTYVFLENSCPLPNTYTTVVENGNSRKSRLSLRIFSYINLNVIYLHCQIQICIETGSATCQPDCFGRTERFSNLIGTAKASCGPLLRSHKVSVKERSDTLRLVGYSLLGIGLFLLFIGSLSSLFFSHRKRIGTYSFSLKPKQDNSPYHVFNI